MHPLLPCERHPGSRDHQRLRRSTRGHTLRVPVLVQLRATQMEEGFCARLARAEGRRPPDPHPRSRSAATGAYSRRRYSPPSHEMSANSVLAGVYVPSAIARVRVRVSGICHWEAVARAGQTSALVMRAAVHTMSSCSGSCSNVSGAAPRLARTQPASRAV